VPQKALAHCRDRNSLADKNIRPEALIDFESPGAATKQKIRYVVGEYSRP